MMHMRPESTPPPAPGPGPGPGPRQLPTTTTLSTPPPRTGMYEYLPRTRCSLALVCTLLAP
ncbi:hypothetical protein RB213_002640 [Colletotrichum asianum]|uniref:Uncharacterized protein n=1 Tax=Colletotrichum asianum TaxID=702518 RepID=A0A8H3WI31_9PEZI|nr:hypothetical protein GQ607_005553 [Colletotrichum asianum]